MNNSRRKFLSLSLGVLVPLVAVSGCSQLFAPPYVPAGKTLPSQLNTPTILSKINATRAANGRRAWSYNVKLARAAQTHARLMVSRRTLSHDLGGKLRELVNVTGYVGALGENLAQGQSSLEGAIEGWLNSPPHRATLLSDKFSEFGLAGASGGSSSSTYWALIAGGDMALWIN